jgi:hypothetical protein
LHGASLRSDVTASWRLGAGSAGADGADHTPAKTTHSVTAAPLLVARHGRTPESLMADT